MSGRRFVVGGLLSVSLLGAGAATGSVGVSGPAVATYPDSQTIPRSGRLPSSGGHGLSLNEPVGGSGAGLVVVSGAKSVGAVVDARTLAPIQVQLRFWHYVRFGSSVYPDALVPWDGGATRTEQSNQPFSVEVTVPYGTKPGVYKSTVTVTADSHTSTLPLTVTVFKVALPKPGQVSGSLMSAFAISPQTYLNAVIKLYHQTTDAQIRAANASLFAFLSSYRIAPANWGYGTPSSPAGYVASTAWWKDTAGNMTSQLGAGQFPDLWLPLSNNRGSAGHYVGGADPFKPEGWCGYLGAVKNFWNDHGFLTGGAVPYAYTYDEPGDTHVSLIGRQATALHRCFPGAKLLITATPDTANARLYDGKGTDDVDIWSVVDWRYYGVFTVPAMQKRHQSRKHEYLDQIATARSHGAKIFAYTYYGVPGFPSFRATEPLSNPRMFVLWAALEGLDGILYGDGMTSYKTGVDPLSSVDDGGEGILIYPGASSPVPSARLEQIRDGIEDAEVLAVVRRRFGPAKVRQILGSHGLFSADASGVKLACVVGCDLKGVPPQAWPRWSHDSTTAGRIEAARLDALRVASS